jgi:hypothetical protein
MTIRPDDYFQSNEAVASNLKELTRYIRLITEYAEQRGLQVFWRGQAHHEWALMSSLARRLAQIAVVDDELMDRIEQALLDESDQWILELKEACYKEPLAKLAYLQHHGVPTRLLDFTSNPWFATFFAAESHDDSDGRLFALLVRENDVLPKTPRDTPWRSYKTNQIKIYDPAQAGIVFSRLQAQKGVLAVGRLPSTQPHRLAHDPVLGAKRSLLAEEVRRLLSIPFKLSPLMHLNGLVSVPPGATSPVGLTIRLHIDKESLRRKLSRGMHRATHRTMYPDVGGMVTHSTVIRGLARGVIVV